MAQLHAEQLASRSPLKPLDPMTPTHTVRHPAQPRSAHDDEAAWRAKAPMSVRVANAFAKCPVPVLACATLGALALSLIGLSHTGI